MPENRKTASESGSAKRSMSGMGAKLSETADEMQEQAADTYEQAAEWASERGAELSNYTQRQMRVMRNYFNENPLMLGFVGLGLGLLAGALIPVTRAERRLFRPLGRELREGAGETMRQVRRKAEALVETDGETASRPSGRSTGASGSRHTSSRSRH